MWNTASFGIIYQYYWFIVILQLSIFSCGIIIKHVRIDPGSIPYIPYKSKEASLDFVYFTTNRSNDYLILATIFWGYKYRTDFIDFVCLCVCLKLEIRPRIKNTHNKPITDLIRKQFVIICHF